MRWYNVFSILVVVLVLTRSTANAQPYTFHTYSLAEGLPQSQAGCALTDSRGYLWVGTEGGGLCRFNGDRFTTFTASSELPSNFIRVLYQHEDYQLWIGTSRGLCRYDGHHFTRISGLETAVTSIAGYQDSMLLIGANHGLYVLPADRDSLVPVLQDSMGTILHLFKQRNVVWIGTTTGLWVLRDGEKKPELSARLKGQGIYSIQEADDHSLWLASWSTGIIRYNIIAQRADTLFSDPLVLLPNTIYGPAEDQLWVGTQNNGLILMDIKHGHYTQLSERDGLPHYNVKSIVLDANDQFWITTSGGGIAKCTRQNFRHYTRSEGLANNRVYAVHQTADHALWIATGNSGIQRMDSTGWHSLRMETMLGGAKCKSITSDAQGRLWVGTEGRGIIRIDSTGYQQWRIKDGLPDEWIQKIVTDRKNTVWVAMYTGGLASIITDSTNTSHISAIPLPYQKLSAIAIDSFDRIWVGTNDGRIFVIENNKLIWSTGPASGLPKSPIRALAFDTYGRVWVGTQSRGLFSGPAALNQQAFEPLDSRFPISSLNVYLLQTDRDGHLWVGTETGVDKLSFQPDGQVKGILSFGKHEGFLGIETCHDAVALGVAGKIWFGTMNGLMEYTPGQEIRNQRPPKLHFENISLFYKPLRETIYDPYVSGDGRLLPGLEFRHKDNHLSFNFVAVDLDSPEDIVYRWKLIGIDTTWSPPAKQSAVSFASLLPGKYILQVQAATDTTTWSQPIEAAFSIETPYWQKTAFKVTAGLAAVLFLSLIFWGWSRRLRQKEFAKREKLKLQNHLLQLEQKALQLQMNPHFIFNALTSIKSLVSQQHLPKAQEEINAFAQLMRGVLNNSRKANISLSEEVAVLERYLHLEQLCHQHKFEYSIRLPQGADPDEIELPPMLIQPFVENAVVHGVAHLTQHGRIEVHFEIMDGLLVCKISDNGLGREKAAQLRAEKKPGHQPVALEVTRERLEVLKGTGQYVPLKTDDLLNAAGEITGTLVTLTLPLKLNW